ncbi:glycosyltransferase family 2 protein [Limibaculum sp. M0105]|uniref:Glycosyltransferase family 2 protein n=1 Tax=Thermohalobaculum xanthum TaxID=2753746 RepID=A0A8J7M7E6_9RHOB|nr:glycosyltransferase family 2 protein [Thermohalobaculum xanthum]MBK0399595.1 glycosyltransferase family 2 protein [Thermohalobaculum xanthum]
MDQREISDGKHETVPEGDPVARPAPFRLSVIVPMFNEAEAVDAFLDRILPLLSTWTDDFEVICIDDGSRDATAARVLARRRAEPRVKLICFARNFGKEAALSAGIDHATGDAVVTIDADLQHPPELMGEMIARWREGVDVVAAMRSDRSHDSAARGFVSGAFYRVFNKIAERPIPPEAGDFRLMDRAVIHALRRLPERNRFMKGLFAWVGFRAEMIPYEHTDRVAGESKFRFWSLWNFALDGITAFSTLPLRVWSYLGFSVAFIAMVYASFIVLRTIIFGADVPGYASILTAVLFIGGIQLVSLGILGEYIGRILIETKQRPLYLVRAAWGLEDHED